MIGNILHYKKIYDRHSAIPFFAIKNLVKPIRAVFIKKNLATLKIRENRIYTYQI